MNLVCACAGRVASAFMQALSERRLIVSLWSPESIGVRLVFTAWHDTDLQPVADRCQPRTRFG